MFQLEKDGPEGKHWGQGGNPIESAIGFANYVFMVDPKRGAELRARAAALLRIPVNLNAHSDGT